MRKRKIKTPAPQKASINNEMIIRDWIYAGLLLVVIAIMPLVVRYADMPAPPELFAMYVRSFYPDYFAHYKSWALGLAAVAIAFYGLTEWAISGNTKLGFHVLLSRWFKDENDEVTLKSVLKAPPIIAAGVFLLFALISALFSNYRFTSWRGTVERSEGMLAFLAYFTVWLAAMLYVRGTKHAKVLMYGLAFSSIIMGLIGLSQFLERDFFMTAFGQRILLMGMTPQDADFIRGAGGISSPFVMAYGTLYNPNTFGKYTAMVAPILLAAALAFDEGFGWKAILVRVGFFLGGVLMLIGVFGSRSLGGFIGLGAALGIIILAVICRLIYQVKVRIKDQTDENAPTQPAQKRRTVTWVLGGLIVILLGVGLYFIPPVNQRIDLAMTRFNEALRGEVRPMDTVNFADDRFSMVIDGQEQFTVVVSESEVTGPEDSPWQWQVYDATGQQVPLYSRVDSDDEFVAPIYTYHVPGYGTLRIQDFLGFFTYRDIAMVFEHGRIFGINPDESRKDLSVPVPSVGFYGREHWGSNRGYIWSRTIPLMPSRAIIGSGPDTFTLVFPQHDMISKMVLFDSPRIPVDKAHNVYLQAWVTTGGVSALALMFLFAFYIITTFISLVKSKIEEGTFLFGLRFGLMAGISAFSVAAMSTDSTIGSSGVFYVLLGLGYGLNLLAKRMAKAD